MNASALKRTEIITPEFLDVFADTYPEHRDLRHAIIFMSTGYYVCCKHPYLSDEWVAGDALHASNYNKMIEMLGETIAQEIYRSMRARFAKHGFVASSDNT